MNIIYKKKESFVIEVSNTELAYMLGYHYITSDMEREINRRIAENTPFKITSIYENYTRIKDYKKLDVVKEMKTKLFQMSVDLEAIEETLKLSPIDVNVNEKTIT